MLNTYLVLLNAHCLIMFKIKGLSNRSFLLLCEVRWEKERLQVTVLNSAALSHAWPFFLGIECALILCHDWAQSGCLAPTLPQNGGRAGPGGKPKAAHGQPGETRPLSLEESEPKGQRRTGQALTQQELERMWSWAELFFAFVRSFSRK